MEQQGNDTDRLFEAMFEDPKMLVGLLDPDGTLRDANRTALELIDADREDVVGTPFPETPWWSDSPETQAEIRGWIERAAEGEYVEYESEHVGSADNPTIVSGTIRPVSDGDGDVVALIVSAGDITERRNRERELASQKKRLAQLNRINDTLRTVNQELIRAEDRTNIERAVCEKLVDSPVYTGAWIGRYELENERIRPVSWAGIADEYMETLDVRTGDSALGTGPAGRAVETGDVQAVDDIATDDSVAPWRERLRSRGVEAIAAIPVVRGETTHGIIGVYANRSNVFSAPERRALSELGRSVGNAIHSIDMQRELERQNERLSEFASIVSHDLRNPLNVAMGRLDMARRERDSDALETVAQAHDRMAALIDDLLTLARQGDAVDETEPVDLAALLSECWRTVETAESTLTVDTDRVVRADESRLRQLLENLLRNAVEHGGPDVSITVGDTDDGFYVADDGPGIPPEDREAVFETGYSTAVDGTGFGLGIVEQIAEAHGWSISVTDSAAGGARFEIEGVTSLGE